MTGIRAWVNRCRRKLWHGLFFRILFGERHQGLALAGTRISPSTCIEHERFLHLGDDVFIGHFNFIEASAGVKIGRGTQITNFVSIISHSTHRSVRVAAELSGQDLKEAEGAVLRAPIAIGERCFIGPHSSIEAGTTLGHGTLVAAHSRVRGVFPDFSVLAGSPAKIVGDTRNADEAWLAQRPALQTAYKRWLACLNSESMDR